MDYNSRYFFLVQLERESAILSFHQSEEDRHRAMSRIAARAAVAANRGRASSLRFPTLQGALDVPAKTAVESKNAMAAMVEELRSKLKIVEAGGGDVARKRHKGRGKLLARERIEALVDPGTPFLELAPLAGHEASVADGDDGGIPGGGVVAGIGRVEGLECMIVANDATVKGGTYFPITVKKHLRAQVSEGWKKGFGSSSWVSILH